jgi:leukotriene-A4 hydrolase
MSTIICRTFDVLVEYETAPTASALQWLTLEQTAGKTHPYMFSQCQVINEEYLPCQSKQKFYNFQSIHCRSIMPCQDTPYVKLTYSAEVDADADLTVLLSAVSCGTPALVPGTSLVI